MSELGLPPPQERDERFLSNQERQILQRLLSHPEDLPKKFSSWIEELVKANAKIRVAQVVGLNQFQPYTSTGGSFSNHANTAYADSGLTQLTIGKGQYLLQFGMGVVNNTGGVSGTLRLSPSVNGATPADADSIQITLGAGLGHDMFGVGFKVLTANQNNNTVKLMTKVSASQFSADRLWMMLQRIGN